MITPPPTLRILLMGLILLLAGGAARAHKPSDAYLTLTVTGDGVEQRLDVHLRDLDRELDLDRNQDGQLQWGEVRSRADELQRWSTDRLALGAGGQACSSRPAGPPQIDEHSDGAYVVLRRRWTCAAAVSTLAVDYRLFADSDATHRGILRLQRDTAPRESAAEVAVLVPRQPGDPVPSFGPTGDRPATGWLGFVAEGVHHILIGTDHVLFLLALLLPAVLVRRTPAPGQPADAPEPAGPDDTRWMGLQRTNLAFETGGRTLADPAAVATVRPRGWAPAPAWRPVLTDVLRVVTAFTVAHSITLALAVLDVIDPPSRWVESLIAASVLLTAIDNLRPMLPRQRWPLTFLFGLVHGFGFAGALKDLGVGGTSLLEALAGFNVGVELGQLGLVALFLPLAWVGRGTRLYQRGVMVAGSGLIALLATVWLIERAFDVVLAWP